MNVIDVYFSAKDGGGRSYEVDPARGTAAAITVGHMCPQCGEEVYDSIDFSEISEELIGKQTFTWKGEQDCSNWSNHKDAFDSSYNYSIIFTLNG